MTAPSRFEDIVAVADIVTDQIAADLEHETDPMQVRGIIVRHIVAVLITADALRNRENES